MTVYDMHKIPTPLQLIFSKKTISSLQQKIQFPHLSRIFPAKIRFPFQLVFITIVALLILINVASDASFKGEKGEWKLRQDVMRAPFDFTAHEQLGQYYLYTNRMFAEREYRLAQEYFKLSSPSNPRVLGSQSSPWQTWLSLQNRSVRLKNEMQYWTTVRNTIPSYLFASIKLAVLSYSLGETDQTRQYINQVQQIAPNNETARILLNKL